MYKVKNDSIKKSKRRFLNGTVDAEQAIDIVSRFIYGGNLLDDLRAGVKHTEDEIDEIIRNGVNTAIDLVLWDSPKNNANIERVINFAFDDPEMDEINNLCEILEINITIL